MQTVLEHLDRWQPDRKDLHSDCAKVIDYIADRFPSLVPVIAFHDPHLLVHEQGIALEYQVPAFDRAPAAKIAVIADRSQPIFETVARIAAVVEADGVDKDSGCGCHKTLCRLHVGRPR